MAALRGTITFTDLLGVIAKVAVFVASTGIDPSGGPLKAIRDGIIAAMKCYSQRAETGGVAVPTATSPSSGYYASVEDRLIATFQGDDGSTTLYEIPGPKSALFVTDSILVDETNADFITWKNYVQSHFKSIYGGALLFVKGIRASKKEMKI